MCTRHWRLSFQHNLPLCQGQPADADTIGSMEGVGDDGARLDTKPAEKADGASSRSGADADASEVRSYGYKSYNPMHSTWTGTKLTLNWALPVELASRRDDVESVFPEPCNIRPMVRSPL